MESTAPLSNGNLLARTNGRAWLDAYRELNGFTESFCPDEWLYAYSGPGLEDIDDTYLVNVFSEGGGEGEGEHVEMVFEIRVRGTEEVLNTFRVTGSYDSWNGTEWHEDSMVIVEAREVVVTKYFTVRPL